MREDTRQRKRMPLVNQRTEEFETKQTNKQKQKNVTDVGAVGVLEVLVRRNGFGGAELLLSLAARGDGGGAAAAVCLLPAAAAAVGFGSAGISASSTAASLMSMSWKVV